MKYNWTKEEIMDNRGCYFETEVEGLSSINNPEITLVDIMESEISIREKVWFIRNNADLSVKQKCDLAFLMAKSVAVIFNNKYPDDNSVNACLDGIEKSNQGLISSYELLKLKNGSAPYTAEALTSLAAEAVKAGVTDDASAHARKAAEAGEAHTISLQTVIINFIKSQL